MIGINRIVTGMATLLAASLTLAQADQKAALQEKLAALKQAMAANQVSLQQYTWTAHTEVSLKGEVKNQKDELCRYGSDGKVVKTPTGTPPPQKEMHGVKKRVVEKKVGEMQDYMERAGALIQHYVPPTPEKMQEVFQAGKAQLSKSDGGIAELVFKDYYKSGDALTLGFDTAAKKLTKVNVDSYLDDVKDKVTLDVSFQTLPDGTNYVGKTHLRADAKQIDVNVVNRDYKK